MTCPCHVCAVERAVDDASPTVCRCHPSMCRPIPNGECRFEDLPAEVAHRVRLASSGCWENTNKPNGNGYGIKVIRRDGRVTSKNLHRYVFEAMVGPVPSDLQLDHLCRNRKCCNPAHLEPVTRRVNVWRGSRPRAASGSFGCHLQQARIHAGLTKTELGQRMHRGWRTITAWEANERRPSEEQLTQLSELLREDLARVAADLWPDDDPKPEEPQIDGAALRRARIAAGLSQQALAARVGCSQRAVCKWELRLIKRLPALHWKLAEVLAIDPEVLVLDEQDPVVCSCHPTLCRPGTHGVCGTCRRPVLELIDTPAVRALVADPTWRPELRGKL